MKEIPKEYALIAEITSALAIIISLVFVGAQMKANTKATQDSMFQGIEDIKGTRGFWCLFLSLVVIRDRKIWLTTRLESIEKVIRNIDMELNHQQKMKLI
ncbi:hypothetical protein [Fulvivirga sedimenti]|uniref:Uncharacterized protein n=1 Tax=Fulvivirga sedimenti TaxID=2879465 RepID=A0A9X1HUK7_9BACT|nr:hypothetical protein [Fulvivirga sedimenti]MCA6075013.1 hypothetical protein [Fulvivirga sedimenti]MCA6076190.1 hypothetical protein [Fulvivirga sedimenti]MCA6077318.1 hypothetical protein [Fulvivirga sedimenti]